MTRFAPLSLVAMKEVSAPGRRRSANETMIVPILTLGKRRRRKICTEFLGFGGWHGGCSTKDAAS